MRSTDVAARVGALLLSPVALAAIIVAPTLAAGVYLAATPPGGESVVAAPVSNSGDPLSPTRKSLASTTLPLGLLSGGMTTLTDGGIELDNGAHRLSDGLHQARGGSVELADGMTQLREGVWQLGDGSSKVSGGVDKVVDSLTGLGAIQGQVQLIVSQSIDSLRTSTDPAAQGAIDQLTTVQNMLTTQGVGSDVMNQLQELKTGARTLSYQLNDPKSEFVDGIGRATDGSGQLRDGLIELDNGGNQLIDGTGRLVSGTAPMTGVLSGVQASIKSASESLPAANLLAADTTGGSPSAAPTTYLVRNALPDWPYLVSALLLVGAAVAVALLGTRQRFPKLVTVGVALAAIVTAWSVQDGLGFGALAAIAVVSSAWALAFVAAGRAVISIAGRIVGRAILLVGAAVQLVICGMAGAGFWLAGPHIASFVPMGQVMTALGDISSSGAGVLSVLSVVVALATAAVALGVQSVHSSRSASAEARPLARNEAMVGSAR